MSEDCPALLPSSCVADDSADGGVQDYLLHHRLPDVIEHLAFAIMESKPLDHVAFTRRWLANLREKMSSTNLQTPHGINLFSIDGNKLQKFQPTRPPPLPCAAAVSPSNDSALTTSYTQPPAACSLANTPSGGAKKLKAITAKKIMKNQELAKKAFLEQLLRAGEKLHKDDEAAALAFLQTLAHRRAGRQKREAEDAKNIALRQQREAAAAQETGDDDEAVIDSSRRRIAVSATPLSLERAHDFQITEIDKTEEERAKLMNCVNQCSLFTSLDDAQKELVVRAMVPEEFGAGCEILTQGQPGKETFFLVVSGMAEVIKDRKVVAPIQPGHYFGELELMYNAADCAATIKTVTPVAAYKLGKETYQHIVLNAALARRALYLQQIERVGIFSTLKDYDKMRVAEALTTHWYAEGDALIRCGEPVHWMFIVMDGCARVVGRDPEGKPINVIDLGVGHVLGELEFLFHHNAVADVVVLSKTCRVARLNRKHFEMIVGDTTDEMKQYIASKDIYKHYIEHAEDAVKKDIEVAKSRNARRNRNVHFTQRKSGTGGDRDVLLNTVGLGSLDAAGEVIYEYGSRLCRFPLSAVAATPRVFVVGLLEDGTVQQWNDVAESITKYSKDQAIGQSIFSFLTSEEEQSAFHQMLRHAREWMGTWEGFKDAGLHKPRAFQFTQSDGLVKVQLLLALVPAVFSEESSTDMILAVGTEVKIRPSASRVDLGQWLKEKLQPRLTSVAKLLSERDLSPVMCKRAKNGIAVCERTVEQFVRIANHSTENAMWHPVSVHALFQRVLSAVSAEVHSRGNKIATEIEDISLNQQVFLDIENIVQVLTLLIEDVNLSSRGVDIVIRAEVAGEQSSAELTSAASGGNFLRLDRMNSVSASFNMNDSATPSLDTSSETKLLRFSVTDTAEVTGDISGPLFQAGDDDDIGSGAASRGVHMSDVKTLLSKMGAVLSTAVSVCPPSTAIVVELPLVLAEHSGNEADSLHRRSSGQPDSGPSQSFTTVLVERSAVQRNNVCQVLWSRRHAVLPVGTWNEVTRLVESGTCDILVIDPESLSEDPSFLKEETDPFDALRALRNRMAIIVTSDGDVAPGRKRKAAGDPLAVSGEKAQEASVLQLPKPWQMKTLIDTFIAAERTVLQFREEEQRITALRNTFSETKRGAYETVRLLGRGAFGEVYEVVDELTGGRMAMKTMRLKKEADVDSLVHEIRTMTQLQHENIIHYFYCEKSSDSELKIFMELASGGTLQDKIKQTPGGCGLSEVEILRHLRDLLDGLQYIHAHRYLHCDIKTANALLDAKGRTKLGDFGTAKKLAEGELVYVISGTPAYMAPEVVSADAEEHVGYDFKADIWSLGCVVLEMATGQPPFFHIENAQGMGIFRYVSELTDAPDLSPLFHCSPHLYQFVKACLEPNPAKRPSAAELQKFPFLTAGGADTTAQAEKLVKRAQLLHVLSSFVAFVDPDEVAPGGTAPPKPRRVSSAHSSTEDGDSFFASDEEDEEVDVDSHLDNMAKTGGFFSDDDDDDDE